MWKENSELELNENPSFPNFSAHVRLKDTTEPFVRRAAESKKVCLCLFISPKSEDSKFLKQCLVKNNFIL